MYHSLSFIPFVCCIDICVLRSTTKGIHRYFYNRAIYFIKKNIYLTYIVLTAGIVNIILNYHYVPIYGYQAAAYTTLVAYLVMCILSWWATVHYLKLPPLPLKRILVLMFYLLGLVSFYFFFLNGIGVTLGNILLKGILFSLFASLIYWHNLKKILDTT